MKRFLTAILSAIGLSSSAASETNMVDPKEIYFSLATINDALPATDASEKPTTNDLVIHEDDWRQFEAVASSYSAEIKAEIADVQKIFKEKSEVSGEYRIFKEMHVRKRIANPLPKPTSWTNLLAAAGVQESSVARVGIRGEGFVKDGFSFPVAALRVFGIRHDDNVDVLCFDLTRTPGLSEEAANRLGAFLESAGVVFVHWPSATVLDDKEKVVKFLRQKNEMKN
jgi:hypothetical protein